MQQQKIAGKSDKYNTSAIVPGMLTLTSQYKIPEKKTMPNKYPEIKLFFGFLSSRAKKNGRKAIHARGHRLNRGYAKINKTEDKIDKNMLYTMDDEVRLP